MPDALAALLLALTPAPTTTAPPAPAAVEWRAIPADDLLVIETGKGRILVEMRPDLAPAHVARVRELAREGYYDGALFYRVIDNYMAQGGDRSVNDAFTSDKPDLKAEFALKGGADGTGWLGASPLTRLSDGRTVARFCAGTAAFAHYADPDTANSQFFLMRAPAPFLEGQFTVWGRVVSGQEVVRVLNVGEPPAQPDVMTRVRVAADLPARERPAVEIADTAGRAFQAGVEQLRKARGAAFTACDVAVVARVP